MSTSVLNPVVLAEHVNRQYLRYRLSRLPLKDPRLKEQARALVGKPDKSPFVKGPYVSLARPWKLGKTIEELTLETPPSLHRRMHTEKIAEFPRLMLHQEQALRSVIDGRNVVVSTGTGSGKTEAFVYPIISHCLRQLDSGPLKGVVAVLIYPMNALANDQRDRLRRLLAGTGITFGLYTGATPERRVDADRNYDRMGQGEGRDIYERKQSGKAGHRSKPPIPFEERPSVEEMIASPPQILVTNAKQLELILTRAKDIGIFLPNNLRFIVVDEAHTFTGVQGSEVAILIRRLREFCGRSWDEVVHIGTSATIVDPLGDSEGSAKRFASRFFGVQPETVRLIQESYDEPTHPVPSLHAKPVENAIQTYDEVVSAVEGGDPEKLSRALTALVGEGVSKDDLAGSLYSVLSRTDIVQLLHEAFREPEHLEAAIDKVWRGLGRPLPVGERLQEAKAEVLLWLALGAAAEKNEDYLFRPKLHFFVRGVEGAVAYFVRQGLAWSPVLAESRRDAVRKLQLDGEKTDPQHLNTRILDIYYCRDCGQHYFSKMLDDVRVDRGRLVGGIAAEAAHEQHWVEADGGVRVLVTDNLVGPDDQQMAYADAHSLHLCCFCGVLQRGSRGCLREGCGRGDGLVPMVAIAHEEPTRHCISCGGFSSGYGRDMLVPARAVQVADVHILAQEIITGLPRSSRKLLLFADSRQDAAFQAAWMRDHARRYRIRQLIYDRLKSTEGSFLTVGDTAYQVVQLVERDPPLLESVAPELLEQFRGNREGIEFQRALRRFFHIQTLREFAEGAGRIETLENWGLVEVSYSGLSERNARLATIAAKYGLPPTDVSDFAIGFLDHWRRDGYVHSSGTQLYSRTWDRTMPEIRNGWLQEQKKYPRALTLEAPGTRHEYPRVKGVLSKKGTTWAMQRSGKVFEELRRTQGFIEDLWSALVAEGVLIPARMESVVRGGKLEAIPGTAGSIQVNEEKLRLRPQMMLFECRRCGASYGNRPPRLRCLAWNCSGVCEPRPPSAEVYDVSVITRGELSILLPAEHSAQVPHKRREEIEREFKSSLGGINCIVATPTLELGVDIGDLDAVLLRNVPPTPSNYWQRAGRAGRRHRMAVVFTYARTLHHDTTYFEDPLQMLRGTISPPRINLRNEHMVRRHINAIAISIDRRILASENPIVAGSELNLSRDERTTVEKAMQEVLPDFVGGLLFLDDGTTYRPSPPDVASLKAVFLAHRPAYLAAVEHVFSKGYWPTTDSEVLNDLEGEMDGALARLQAEVTKVFTTFGDARKLRDRYHEVQRSRKLSPDEEQLLRSVSNYIRVISERHSIETYTLNVLSATGFLPGYGFYEPGVVATYPAEDARIPTFELSRARSLAIREFVPGNLLYANGGQFAVAKYWFPVDEQPIRRYTIDLERGMALPSGQQTFATLARAKPIEAVRITDSLLQYRSRVSDDEDYPYRMPCEVQMMSLGEGFDSLTRYDLTAPSESHPLHLLHYRNMEMAFVNLGPRRRYEAIVRGEEGIALGFPVCHGCGSVRGPTQSAEAIDQFIQRHSQDLKHGAVGWFGFDTQTEVDHFALTPVASAREAVSLGWSLVIAAMDFIELEAADLEVRPVPATVDSYSAWIVDRHPGGSGLLDQFLEFWPLIVKRAAELTQNCPAQCAASCPNCLQLYENQRDALLLDRVAALRLIERLLPNPTLQGQRGGVKFSARPVGDPDTGAVRALLEDLDRAGITRDAQIDQRIMVSHLGHHVRPDIHWLVSDGRHVCVYVDGSVHEVPEVRARDERIRKGLEDAGWSVYAIRNESVRDPSEVQALVRWLETALKPAAGVKDADKSPLAQLIVTSGPPGYQLGGVAALQTEDGQLQVSPLVQWNLPGRPVVVVVLATDGKERSTGLPIGVFKTLAKAEGWKTFVMKDSDVSSTAVAEKLLLEIHSII